jgi:hypothetical protein
MKRKFLIATGLFFAGILLFSACQEEYFPKLDNVEPMLVVDGLFTNQPGPHTVRLSQSVKFQQAFTNTPVSGASLYIAGSDGASIPLSESQPGVYQTPAGYSGQIGHSYVLHIETPDGQMYQSDPQLILQPVNAETVNGQISEEVFYNYSAISNRVYATTAEGTEAYLQVSDPGTGSARYRFNSIHYLQYLIIYGAEGVAPTIDYCWIKRSINDQLGNDIGNPNNHEISSEKVGFVMRNRNFIPYYGFPEAMYDFNRVLINKIYTLNDDSYEYHKAKNDQLSDEGRFFDPIAAQLKGNVRNLTNPNIKVLGLFEASSEITLTYNILTNYAEGTISIVPVHNLDHVPNTGCLYEQYPSHWIF